MNTNLFYFYSFIRSLVPVYPIYLLLFESNGLSLGEISLLLAIWSIPVILLEIPTGILSDHWSRKNMLIIADTLRAACYILWYISDGFFLYALGFVLWGISEAFFSGSLEALVYDGLKTDGKHDSFDKIYGRGESFSNAATAISMLSGGFLSALLGMKTVVLISAFASLIASIISAQFKEVNFFRKAGDTTVQKPSNHLASAFSTLREAARFFINSRTLLLMAVLSVFGIGISGIIDEYDQLIASGYGLSLGMIGVWGGLRYFLQAAGSALAYRLKGILSRFGINDSYLIVNCLCILSGVLIGIAGLFESIWLMPLYALFYLVMSSSEILVETMLQRKIEEQGRSTVHSILSLAHNGSGIIMFTFFAFLLPRLKLFSILKITSIYILLLCFVLSLIYWFRTKSRNSGEPR